MLLAITVLSFGAALLSGSLAWRMTREERERSAARVAALGAAIDASGSPPASPVHVAALFAERSFDRVGGQPRIRIWVAAAMGVLILSTAALQWPAGHGAHATGIAAPAAAAPLELLSMQHAREGESLTVTGLVRDPPTGASIGRLSAVVLAFDRNGTFVTSNRAPIDFLTLAPGDESPFTVLVPRAGNVARYRVAFRTEDGVVRHIDRRNDRVRLAADSRQ